MFRAMFPQFKMELALHQNGDTVLVASGTYTENIDLSGKAIVVMSEAGPQETMIVGRGPDNVVLGATGSTVQGFTISGGKYGIQASSATMTIRENIITGNTFGILTNNRLKPLFERNLLYNNSNSGIFAMFFSQPIIRNNTIVNNGRFGVVSNSGAGVIVNNIIASNRENGIICTLASSTPEIKYNNFFNHRLDDISECQADSGNIFVDPEFVGGQPFDYHLQSTSPCIDAGDPNSPPDPDSTPADLGAFYYESVTGVELGSGLPIGFAVFQNYPNPFNPGTLIRYELPKASDVTISVYNLLGQKVAQLLNEHKPAGSHEVHFDASALSSGVYLYRIQTSEFQQMRKMLLVK